MLRSGSFDATDAFEESGLTQTFPTNARSFNRILKVSFSLCDDGFLFSWFHGMSILFSGLSSVHVY